jgi:hypothetical protein
MLDVGVEGDAHTAPARPRADEPVGRPPSRARVAQFTTVNLSERAAECCPAGLVAVINIV